MDGELATLMQAVHRPDRRWTPAELRQLVEVVADRRDFWPSDVAKVDGGRLYQRVYRDDLVEIWVIYWGQDTSTDMHDHGGSVGAMRVIDGALTEINAVPGGVKSRTLDAGSSTAFPVTYVHDVSNQHSQPARSVHAYSPPISKMTYYALTEGKPVPVRTELVSDGAPV